MVRVVREVIPPNEKGGGQRITKPDMAPSIASMVDRFRRGLPQQVKNYQPVYNGEVELPDIKKMDLTEIDEYSRNVKSEINELKIKGGEIRKRQIQQEAIRAEKRRQQKEYSDPAV